MKLQLLIIIFLIVCSRHGNSQTSELYMISSPNVYYPVGTTYVYQGGHLVRSWTHASTNEIAMAVVGGSVRQLGLYYPGSEYTLNGTPTGTHYAPREETFDGTTDGHWIYGWNFYTASLMRFDLNWHFQENLFSLGTNYGGAFMGITYDSENNSIWLAPWNSSRGFLYNYSLDGQLLHTLTLPNSSDWGNGLAYDSADDTLWFFNWRDQRYEQYSKDGTLLNSLTGMTRIYGAEFAFVPEPSAFSLLWLGILMAAARSKRRRCRTELKSR